MIAKLVVGEDLTPSESTSVMQEIMGGEATPAQIAAFLVALRLKGETSDEIAAFAGVMREKATRINAPKGIVLDTCGTGGDQSHTFNISTAAALVVAGAGVCVAKHGNRSVSSSSGSADVLEKLGVNINAGVPTVERCMREANIGFLFAPLLHGAMKHAIGPRREMGIRTVFNVLGPLTNPAGASHQLLGVFDRNLTETIAKALMELGSSHVMIVAGLDGMDEITTSAKTQITEVKDGQLQTFEFDPKSLDLAPAKREDLVIESPDEGAAIIENILSGEKGPSRDIVLVNAAAGIAAADGAKDLAAGLVLAAESVDSGAARRSLDTLIRVSNEN